MTRREKTNSPVEVTRARALAASFPSLAGAPGLDPWDPAVLASWAAGLRDEGEWPARLAAAFVLSVWHARSPWVGVAFEVVFAWYVWDAAHRAAFRAWADDPF